MNSFRISEMGKRSLTYEIAQEIRDLHAKGATKTELAIRFNYDLSSICKVIKGALYPSGGDPRIKHGHYQGKDNWEHGSLTMVTWRAMHARCKDLSKRCYFEVSVCERWNSFEAFLEDMGERPQGYTLDRIDPNKGYSKANCRWVCKALQQHNRKDAKLTWEKISEIKHLYAEGFTHAKIAEQFGVAQSTISRVISGKRWKPEKPIIKPGDAV